MAPALISLLAGPLASADTTVGNDGDVQSYTLGFAPNLDTFSYNATQIAVGVFLFTKASFDLDIWYALPDDYQVLLTDPGHFQLGDGYLDGVANPIDSTNPADFIRADIGIDHLLGIAG